MDPDVDCLRQSQSPPRTKTSSIERNNSGEAGSAGSTGDTRQTDGEDPIDAGCEESHGIAASVDVEGGEPKLEKATSGHKRKPCPPLEDISVHIPSKRLRQAPKRFGQSSEKIPKECCNFFAWKNLGQRGSTAS